MRCTTWARSSWPLGILLAGFIAYLPSFAGVFAFDDLPWIVDNEALQHLWPPWTAGTGTLRPLLFFTLALNYAISGLEPWSYHAVNLAIHLATALLLFAVLRRVLRLPRVAPCLGRIDADDLAGSTVLLWVVHPLTTQAVTYIIQRGESLASLFYTGCFYALLRGSRRGARRRHWWAGLVLCWWAAMLTKEIAVTLPATLLLFDILLLTGAPAATWRARRMLYVALIGPPVAAAGVLLATRPQLLGSLLAGDATGFSRLDYALSQPGVLLHYLRLVIWPRPLRIDHGWPVASPGEVVLPLLLAAGALLWLARALRRRSPLSFVGLWFAGILAPTSSFVPLRDLLVEHRMYLPLVAPLFLLVLAGSHLGTTRPQMSTRRQMSARRQKSVRPILLAAAVGVSILLTASRNGDYASELSLWEGDARSPDNARRFYNLQLEFLLDDSGVLDGPLLTSAPVAGDLAPPAAALQAGDPASALARLRGVSSPEAANLRGMALWLGGDRPAAATQWRQAAVLPAARAHLAVAAWMAGDWAEAEERLAALATPDQPIPEVHYNLGTLRAVRGKLRPALKPLQRALALRPGMKEALNNLGAVHEGLRQPEAATRAYGEAARRGHPTARLNLALTQVRRKAYRAALPLLDEVLASHPRRRVDHRAANARALARYFTGDLAGAAQDLRQARETHPPSATLDNNLGCVLMAQGELTAAQELFERALEEDAGSSATHHNLGKLLVILGRTRAAVTHLRLAVQGRPQDAVLAANLREAERRLRRVEERP